MSGVVKELKSFDEEEETGFLGLFKKASNKVATMKAKYAKTEANVNQICKASGESSDFADEGYCPAG